LNFSMFGRTLTSRVFAKRISRPLAPNYFSQKTNTLSLGLQKTFVRRMTNETKSVGVRDPISTIRKDLVTLISDEVNQLKSEPGVTDSYLKEIDFKVAVAEDNEKVSLTRTFDNHNITVEFALPKEDEEDDIPEEDSQENSEGEEEPQEQNIKKVADFDVEIEKKKGQN